MEARGAAGSAADGDGRPIVLVKLGGSLITDKERQAVARDAVIRRLAGEIAELRSGLDAALLIGHGSGSFGHAAAARHRLGRDAVIPGRAEGVSETQAAVASLHRRVADALREAGVPVCSYSPSSAAVASGGRLVELTVEPLAGALSLGLVPLLYGDVVVDRERGATILSTETLLEAAAAALGPRGWRTVRAVWLGATDGVYGFDDATIPVVRAGSADDASRAAGGAAGTDVTGGMAHRLETALRLADRGIPSWIGDGREPGALARAARGEATSGTRVLPPAEPRSPGAVPER